MQPESTRVSEQASTENTSEAPLSSFQHGLHTNHEPAVSLSDAADRAGSNRASAVTSEEQLALDAALAASLQDPADVPARASANRGLSSRNTPSPPARNRITEYEQASTPPVRKREGPGFEVIKKHRSPNDKRSPIQELPNGEIRSLRAGHNVLTECRDSDACYGAPCAC